MQVTEIQSGLVSTYENSPGRILGYLSCQREGGECRDQDGLGTPVTWNLNLPRALHLFLLHLLKTEKLRIFSLRYPCDKETFIVSHLTASTSGERLVFSSPIQIWKILENDSNWPVLCQWIVLEQLM